jgi:hypothetical protein
MITSPGSTRTFATRSMPCWEPVVMSTLSTLALMPYRLIFSTMNSRSGTYPSVMLYCKALGPFSLSTLTQASSTSFSGNSSGAGIPPAKEMTSG